MMTEKGFSFYVKWRKREIERANGETERGRERERERECEAEHLRRER